MTPQQIADALNRVTRYDPDDTSGPFEQASYRLAETEFGDWIKVDDVAAALGLVRPNSEFEVPA